MDRRVGQASRLPYVGCAVPFMVPMRGKKAVQALHELSEAPPGFGVRQSSGALAMEASQPKAPQDWRTPGRYYRAIHSFMVPMRAQKRKGAHRKRHWICADDFVKSRLHPKRLLARRVKTVFNQIAKRYAHFNF